MGKRKKWARKNQKNKKQEDRNKNFEDKIANEKNKIQLDILKSNAFKQRISRFEDKIVGILKLAGLLMFGFALIVVFVLFLLCLVWYCQGDNKASIVLTIIQTITGIVSLGVGIWALILTVKYNETPVGSNNNSMNIRVSTSNSDIQGRTETDVNQGSLQ